MRKTEVRSVWKPVTCHLPGPEAVQRTSARLPLATTRPKTGRKEIGFTVQRHVRDPNPGASESGAVASGTPQGPP